MSRQTPLVDLDQQSASLADLVTRSSPDLNTVMTPRGIFSWVARTASDHFGWDPRDLIGKHQDALCHPDDTRLVSRARLAVVEGGGPETFSYRFKSPQGTYTWVEARIMRVDEEDDRRLVCALRDTDQRRASEIALTKEARTDPLTGIANRSVFMDRLSHALKRLDRNDGLVSVLFLDLDRFKVINDSMGHRMGDGVLKKMAERLLKLVRPADTVARLGGDEFAIILEGISLPDQALRLGERIIEASRVPFTVENESFVCSVSVGMSQTSDPQHSPEDLLQEADLALYRAKDRGRDRAEKFDEELRTRAVGRLGIERMLRRAIADERLLIQYQPVIDLGTERTVAVESLVRISSPDGEEPLLAEAFIDVAEETGLLATIDAWVFAQAIEQAGEWKKKFSGTDFDDVAVNVTARHLADADFTEAMIETMNDHSLPPERFQVELTERVLIEASNSAITGLKALREAGVKVGLDDFGTGFSSLAYLRELPLDFVKIHRTFIHRLTEGSAEQAIVASIVDLCHALDIQVVAEGVETQEELEILQSVGCDRGQGFLFDPAGEPSSIEARVLAGSSAAVRESRKPTVSA